MDTRIFEIEGVGNYMPCIPLEDKEEIEYTIEVLAEDIKKAEEILYENGLMHFLLEGYTLHFKDRKRLLKAGSKLVLAGVKIVKTTGL